MKKHTNLLGFLRFVTALTISTVQVSGSGQSLHTVVPESAGFSSTGLDAVTANLQQHIDEGNIAGVVAAVARDGKLVYFEALGRLDIEQQKPMSKRRIVSHLFNDS